MADFVDRTFVPREIILRVNGRLSYIHWSSSVQKSVAVVTVLAVGWSGFASASYFIHRATIVAKDRLIEQQEFAYVDLNTRFEKALAREARLENRVADFSHSLLSEIETTAALRHQRADLQQRNDSLRQGLINLRDAQQGVLERFSERVTTRADFVESTVSLTGLKPDGLIYGVSDSKLGKGGPLIPTEKVTTVLEPSTGFAIAVSTLNEEWSRWMALQEAIRTLPLAAPLDEYWVSSGFGEREDPMTGQKARHLGIDLVAPLGSSVRATARGVVKFAGRHGRYGNLIEIDHRHGITTQYAHLSKILVEIGQEVEYGERIGVMGNSGRSTGPHVHYEIRSGDEYLDPMKFLKAGARLFEG